MPKTASDLRFSSQRAPSATFLALTPGKIRKVAVQDLKSALTSCSMDIWPVSMASMHSEVQTAVVSSRLRGIGKYVTGSDRGSSA